MKDAFRLLRLPFSVYLMPVFWYALAFVPWVQPWGGGPLHWGAVPWRAAVTFAILHLLVYPASNGFNSLHDRDTGPIGGLAAPPPPPPELARLVTLLDTLALVLAFTVLGGTFGFLLLSYIVVSRAYSAPPLRLKARPLLGTAAVVVFQGAVTCLAVQAGSGLSERVLWSPYNLAAAAGASVLLLGSYPLTQVYQHEEDATRGDRTLSRLLGVMGTFRFAQVASVLGAAYVIGLGWWPVGQSPWRFWTHGTWHGLKWPLLFGLWMLPTAAYVSWWQRQVTAGHGPTHRQAMRLNQLASLSVSAFFLLTLAAAGWEMLGVLLD